MRVVHVMASAARGGGADHLVGLLPPLVAAGWQCAAVVGRDGPLAERLQGEGIETHTVELMQRRLDASAPGRLARALAPLQPDLVHLHGTRAAFFGAWLRLSRSPRAPSVYTAHGLSFRQEKSTVATAGNYAAEAVACRGADHVISVSRLDLEELVRLRFVRSSAGTHIPNAVDTTRFAPGDREAARRMLELPADAMVVGTVSRLVPQKSVADLIHALDQCPDVTLVIVGDGPLSTSLRGQAARFGERVRFLGARDDVAEILPAFDIFALSSRWEGEPIALLEALAAGLPCVATATPGAREILEASDAGVLVEMGAPEALGKAIAALSADGARRKRMAAAARPLVGERSWEEAAARAAEVYRQVIDG